VTKPGRGVSQNHEIRSDDVRNESDFRLVLQLVEGGPAGEHGHMRAFGKELKDSSVLVSAQGLGFPGAAKIVRAGPNGEPITDGVFPESKEFLAGCWIIEVETVEQAYKLAARASATPGAGGERGSIPIGVRRVLPGAPLA